MSHHGWVSVIDVNTITPNAVKSPFGRMMAAQDHSYDSHAIALLAGGLGPMQESVQTGLLAGAASPSAGKGSNHAGFTFLGQFIDHDMTEFRMIGDGLRIIPSNPTIGQRQTVLEDLGVTKADYPTTTNGRTGKLDLDAVYGLLGGAQPDLFDANGQFRNNGGMDILRGDGFRNKRLIADPRNDENKLVVQIHLLFEALHNKVHGAKSGGSEAKGPTGPVFIETRAEVTAAYQRIVLHDYLPRIVRKEHLLAVLGRLKTEATLYQKMNRRVRERLGEFGVDPQEAARAVAVPVEFSHAAFRLGHSQLLNGYLLRGPANNGVRVALFDTGQGRPDLRGDQALASGPGFQVEWRHFFKVGTTAPQAGNPIDGTLPNAIFRLPPPAVGEPPVSLAERNIRRGIDFGLPSGQEAAAALAEVYGYVRGITLEEIFPGTIYAKVAEVVQKAPELQWATPLWYYILMEAGTEPGPQLGPVGGLIVAETLLGALVETRLGQPGAGSLAEVVDEIQDAYALIPPVADDQSSGPLDWNKTIGGVAEIHTMSQLIRFIGAAAPQAAQAQAAQPEVTAPV